MIMCGIVRNVCWAVLLFSSMGRLQGQTPMLTGYDVSNGLVSNFIRNIYQDSNGLLWIATMNGLSIYDGHRFRNFSLDNGLDHSVINDFYEASPGRVFVSCNNGSMVEFVNYQLHQVIKGDIIVNKFYRSPWGKTIVCTDLNGIYEFEDGRLTKPAQDFPNHYYFSMVVGDDGYLYLGNDSAVHVLTRDYRKISVIGYSGKYKGEIKLVKDKSGLIWANGMPDLWLIKNRKLIKHPSTLKIAALQQPLVYALMADTQGNVWVPGNKGTVIIDSLHMPRVLRNVTLGANARVMCLFEDRDQNVWMGTTLGLLKYNAASMPVLFQLNGPQNENLVNDVGKVNDAFILASNTPGIHLVNTKNYTWQKIDLQARTQQKSVGFSHKGTLMFWGKMLLSIQEAFPLKYSVESFASNSREHVYYARDFKGNLFVSDPHHFSYFSSNGIVALDSVTGTRISGIDVDGDQQLWISLWDDGLLRHKYANESEKLSIIEKEKFFPGMYVRSLHADMHNQIWVGTRYNGLYRLSPKQGGGYDTTQWTRKDNLSADWVVAITSDHNGNIWVAYDYGIDKMIPDAQSGYKVFPFSHVNGLYLNTNTMIADNDGMIWLATMNGLVAVRDSHHDTLPPPKAMLTSVWLRDSSVSIGTNDLKLSYQQNKLTFEYSAPSFFNEKYIAYSYKLDGSGDAAWAAPTTEHVVTYAGLPPGSYRFSVRAMRWDGSWGVPAEMPFFINPPFWRTSWFLVLFSLFVLFALVLYFRSRINTIDKAATARMQVFEAENKALRAQMNPHFLFNSINAIDNLIQSDENDKATVYLGRFAKLLRLVLEHSKFNLISFQKEVDTMRLYLDLQRFRTGDKFEYQMEINEDLMQQHFQIPPMLAQPFLENAIQHGLMPKMTEDRKLVFRAFVDGDTLVYEVEDNGIGRHAAGRLMDLRAQGHESSGIAITSERLKYHNKSTGDKDIIFEDLMNEGNPAGTRVTVRIKIY
jgi:ligand-binding sensor domain-containing protein